MLLNIDSINCEKINELQIDIQDYQNLYFLCFTEINKSPKSIDSVFIDGYKLCSYYCRPTLKKGGVGIWVKNNLSVNCLDLRHFCIERHIEICGIKWQNNNVNYVIITCYRSPAGDLNIFCNTLHDALVSIYKKTVNFIICGDFNCDAYKESREFNQLTSIFSCFNMHHVIGWPTRVQGTSLSTIDNIFINFNNDGQVGVFDNVISDHRYVLFELPLPKSIVQNNTYSFKRTYDQNSLNNFGVALQEESWDDLLLIKNINEAFEYFISQFLFHFNTCFPLRRCNIKNNHKKWLDNEVILSSRNLKDLFIMKKSYSDLEAIYKTAKKNHFILIKNKKKEYYQNKISKSDNPAKTSWNVLSELTNSNKNGKNNITIIDNKKRIENPDELALLFNNFFINTPLEIKNQIPLPKTPIDVTDKYNVNTLFLNPFTSIELYNLLIAKLKNKKSSGPDDIPMFIIKNNLQLIINPLTYLVNLSFLSGTFPSCLKTGKVTPIFKKKDPHSLDNYRPITVPSGFSKILEYSFLDRLLSFINKYNILTDNQHGFRNGKSTATAIHSFYETLIKYIDAGECPVGIFCDLSRAFDCVDHDILINKLYTYGIRGTSQEWIASFLTARKQYVCINHMSQNEIRCYTSDPKQINMGVVQGSVMGPVLFLLYINNIISLSNDVYFTLYADDTSLIISDKSDNTLKNKCEDTLANLINWFNSISLYFNSDKTELIRFHTHQNKTENMNLSINNSDTFCIQSIQNYNFKFLGMYLDPCLTWKAHCEFLTSKLSSVYFLFKNLKPVLTKDQLMALYYAQVESRLRYGICFWGDSTLSHDVFLAQKRIVRCITGVSSTHTCKGIYKDLKILTLYSLYIFEICLFVFKNKNKFLTNSNYHQINTRQSNHLHLPLSRVNIAFKAPSRIGAKIFNSLPSDLKSTDKETIFKKKLKLFLVDKCLYNTTEYFN